MILLTMARSILDVTKGTPSKCRGVSKGLRLRRWNFNRQTSTWKNKVTLLQMSVALLTVMRRYQIS
jgi:hypothetical protein